MYYHASQTPDIKTLIPKVSNHNKPLIYFSDRKENVLVYLSNAVEKYCKETGFEYNGIWQKWASYGFTKDGILELHEYYPNATWDTYKGVSGYIYYIDEIPNGKEQKDIPHAYTTDTETEVLKCAFIPDAYEAIMEEVKNGKIVLIKYEQLSEKFREWNERTIREEYGNAEGHPEYRHFLKGKFDFLNL